MTPWRRRTWKRSAKVSGKRWSETPIRVPDWGGYRRLTAAPSKSQPGFSTTSAEKRVVDTPISESAIVGAAIGVKPDGTASGGRDAVLRLHHLRLRSDRELRRQVPLSLERAPVPIVVRALRRAAAYTAAPSTRRIRRCGSSRRPGFKVIAPATAYDAKGPDQIGRTRQRSGALLRAQGALSPHQGRPAGTDEYTVPIGKAKHRPRGQAT